MWGTRGRKLVKVFQYYAVCIAEWNLMRHLIRLVLRRAATKSEIKREYDRWRKLGSALSTTR